MSESTSLGQYTIELRASYGDQERIPLPLLAEVHRALADDELRAHIRAWTHGERKPDVKQLGELSGQLIEHVHETRSEMGLLAMAPATQRGALLELDNDERYPRIHAPLVLALALDRLALMAHLGTTFEFVEGEARTEETIA